jgi:hypothetical protein
MRRAGFPSRFLTALEIKFGMRVLPGAKLILDGHMHPVWLTPTVPT